MNYFVILIITALGFSLIEMLFDKYPKAQNQLFKIAFISISFLVCIKFYFGPDITQYVEFYETIPSIKNILNNNFENPWNFEIGFNVFCGVLNTLNISFWGMTCIISILYFIPIYLLFNQIPKHRCLALLALVVFDYNLMLCELRQCLATAICLFAFIAYQKKNTNLAIILLITAIFFHKSIFFILIILTTIILTSHIKIDIRAYILLIITFALLLIIPFENIFINTLENLKIIPEHTLHSIKHHFSQKEIIQAVMPIYIGTILIIAYYSDFKQNTKWHWIMWICTTIIIILFQYYFLLNRLRSFFIPFLIIYTIKLCIESNVKDKIPRQIFTLIFIAYALYQANSIQKHTLTMESKVNYASTIFDTIGSSPQKIKIRQLEEATTFWEKDYKQHFKKQKR